MYVFRTVVRTGREESLESVILSLMLRRQLMSPASLVLGTSTGIGRRHPRRFESGASRERSTKPRAGRCTRLCGGSDRETLDISPEGKNRTAPATLRLLRDHLNAENSCLRWLKKWTLRSKTVGRLIDPKLPCLGNSCLKPLATTAPTGFQ